MEVLHESFMGGLKLHVTVTSFSTNLRTAQRLAKSEGTPTRPIKKKFRYLFPPRSIEPKDTP
jgi:hypothetical protein